MTRPTSYPEFVGAEVCPWFLDENFKFAVLVFVDEPIVEVGYQKWDRVLVNEQDLQRLSDLVKQEFGYPIDIPDAEDDLWCEAFGESWLSCDVGWVEIE